jgi:hypothetical protein
MVERLCNIFNHANNVKKVKRFLDLVQKKARNEQKLNAQTALCKLLRLVDQLDFSFI